MERKKPDTTHEVPGGHSVQRRLFLTAFIGVHAAAFVYFGFLRQRLRPAPFEVVIDGPFAPSQALTVPEARDSPIEIYDVRVDKPRGREGVRVKFKFNGEINEDRLMDITLALKDDLGNDLVRQTITTTDARLSGRHAFSSSGPLSFPVMNTPFFSCDDGAVARASQLVLQFQERPQGQRW